MKRRPRKKARLSSPNAGERLATPHDLGFRMPAEWEPHAATYLAWPHNETDWPGKGLMVEWVFAEMARLISRDEDVRIVVKNGWQKQQAKRALTKSGVDMDRVELILAASNRSWMRDSLPLFVTRKRGAQRELASVKWRFNGWARYDDYQDDDLLGASVADAVGARSYAPVVDGRRVVLEGGAIDVDGAGTLLATEECLLSGKFARNKALGKDGTERVLRDYLGITKVIWLPAGIAGDDTSGHVDDFARFVAPGRVVVCEEKNRQDDNFEPLKKCRAVLRRATDARGKKLELVDLPMPSPVFFAGQRLPASYANFYITNGRVLVPTFNDANDRAALSILAELFPKREVVGVYCRDLVLGLGTLHCSTQQLPAAKPFR